MERELIDLIISQGIFSLLFCFLLYYVLKENSRREKVYQDTIKNLMIIIPNKKNKK